MSKFGEQKKEVEGKITKILNDFTEETGVKINYVDYKKENSVGFNNKTDSEAKIYLKNE